MVALQEGLWTRVLLKLKDKLSPMAYDAWFSDTRASYTASGALTVKVRDKFSRDWLLEHYKDLIKRTIREVSSEEVSLEFVVREEGDVFNQEEGKSEIPEDNEKIYQRRVRKDLYLNPRYTFESFVVGGCNRFAHAALLAVAESPAKAYNPLFIYGRVGLGKTHLMQATAHYLAARWPNMKVVYVTSEKFIAQLIHSIQNRTTQKFREKYRRSDALLIDDVHFIAGKESTQEELFNTFNELYDGHKQIIISSARAPRQIAMLEERLVSRFSWGLVTDIQPPDIETRIAILRKKAEGQSICVPEDVICFIADKVKTNIRELEGALIRVSACATLLNKRISLEFAKDVLKEMISEQEKRMTIELIQRRVAEYFNISVEDLKSKSRARSMVYPRQIAMYIVREETEHSLPEIGEEFGGRSCPTVLHAINKIRSSLKNSEKTRRVLHELNIL